MRNTNEFTKHQIVIIGGGSAGITTAAQLLRKNKSLDIAIIEPSEKHYYQPAFTLVGAGTYKMKKTIRDERDLIPQGAKWIKSSAKAIDPDNQTVTISDGTEIVYDYLVVAAGIQYDWGAIPGLKESIGKNGVTSNYDRRFTGYTWELLQNFKGGNVLFTQPSTPIKCGGAPQKIMYLAEDYFRKKGIRDKAHIIFATPGSVLFGVKKFAKTLNRIVQDRDIKAVYFHKLTEIHPDRKEAVFEITNEETGCKLIEQKEIIPGMEIHGEQKVVIPYEILHLAPPQSAPDFIKNSPLAVPGNPLGWVDVDKHTLQHVKYRNVFSLGDVSSTPNAKTAAAVRKQAPVLVQNLLSVMRQQALQGNPVYNGYGSCPLVTAYGKMVLAEFDYENNPTPTFPFDTSKERWTMWILKKYLLPWFYWNRMLKGYGA